ncbi:cephalosporin C deacetylase [Brevibacillus panacihumi W25]|uniref:Cephalosporin C deacetylase n=1 Tax=Brevibacillus panacihumi W25 TaxID=1408254 RepID=V6MAU6_9BACL|nr:acetylxylan esterase [Brevibacillus panacihumi]EST55000.1 cephalosporin C deacetylase [Brevibacillus panacihumi W25]
MGQPYDLPLEQLREYKPALTLRDDFSDFWEESKQLLAQVPSEPQLTAIEYPVDGVRLYELSFAGFGDARICGYYAVPDRAGQHPGLVLYHGYNWSHDGQIHDVVNWALHGYAAFGMLVRGQQLSEDNSVAPHGNAVGWMTKGILSKETYYYRGVYMDAVRALEVLAEREEVDTSRIGVTGGSQGGALSLVAAALSAIPRVVVAEYPYLSHFRRAIDTALAGPYLEINEYFRRNSAPEIEEKAMETLSYYDVMNLAPWVTCPVLVSIGLIDEITPPSTVFAAYNHLQASDKQIRVYRYFGHEPMSAFHMEKLKCLREHLAPNTTN